MIAYFDCYSGISGDMTLGALIDAGVLFEALKEELARLPLHGYMLESETVDVQGIRGTKVHVKIVDQAHEHHRHLSHIEEIITTSTLSERIKARSIAIFRRLARAEAAVHGTTIEEVHFHEVGAIDTIIDIVGTVIGLDMLGIEQVYSAPLPLGSGTITCAHGVLPVPAPATLELCTAANAPVKATNVEGEMVTPTGAAIVCSLAKFEKPLMRMRSVGYGYGDRQMPWPNALRLWIGEAVTSDAEQDTVAVIETHVDDMTPELLGATMDALFAAGALDVTFEPIQMKKNRPGVKVTVIAPTGLGDELAQQLLALTTSLGARVYETRRVKSRRWIETVTLPWGDVRVKFREIGGHQTAAPEYEDCLRVAKAANVELSTVYEAAKATATEAKHETHDPNHAHHAHGSHAHGVHEH
jgi:uncharacterized protein (TIGR00299 family) protein